MKIKNWFQGLSLVCLILIGHDFLLGCTVQQEFRRVQWSDGSNDPAEKAKLLTALSRLDLNSTDSVATDTGKVEWQQQQYKGLPLLGSWIKTVKSTNSREEMIAANVILNASAPKFPASFKDPKKLEAAENEIRKTHQLSKDAPLTQAIWPSPTGLRAVWKFEKVGEDQRINEFIVDGFTQALLQKKAVGSHFSQIESVPAIVFPKGPKVSELEEVLLLKLDRGDTLKNNILQVTSAAGQNVKVSGEPLVFSTDMDRFDQVEVFYLLQNAYQWFKANLGWTWSGVLFVETSVGHPDKTNAAFYYKNKVRLGKGDGVVYDRIPHDPSIVVHESAHAIIDRMTGLSFEGEGGSLHEGLADFFAACHLQTSRMGEVAYRQGEFKRDLNNSLKWGDLSGKIYGDSLVVSGLLWQLKEEIGEKKILGLAIETLRVVVPDETLSSFSEKLNLKAKQLLSTDDLKIFNRVLKQREWVEQI